MKTKIFNMFLLLVLLSSILRAQEECGLTNISQSTLAAITQINNSNNIYDTPPVALKINVKIHRVRPTSGGGFQITPSQVQTLLQNAQNIFSNNGVFLTFIIDPNYDDSILSDEYYNATTNGYEFGTPLLEAYAGQNTDYLNVFFVNTFSNSTVMGAARAIGSNSFAVIYNAAENTVVHEMGHCFGLLHTFQGFDVAGQRENITRDLTNQCYNAETHGDRMKDTHADPRYYTTVNNCQTCSLHTSIIYPDCQGRKDYTPPFKNIMSYGCKLEFSQGQKGMMQLVLQTQLSGILVRSAVTFANKIEGTLHSGSTITVSNESSSVIVSSGESLSLVEGGLYNSKTNSEILNDNYKHHDWDGAITQYRLSEDFSVLPLTQHRTANFKNLDNFIVKKKYAELPNASTGFVSIRDPWRVTGGTQPNTFQQLSSFNYQGFSEQQIQVGNPFYSLRTQQNETVSLGGNVIPFNFINWVSPNQNAILTSPLSTDTDVKFEANGAEAQAYFKGKLITGSSDEFLSGSRRQVVSSQSQSSYERKYMVYLSAGKVWGTISTDGGTSWSNEKLLSSSLSPAEQCSNVSLDINDKRGRTIFSYHPRRVAKCKY